MKQPSYFTCTLSDAMKYNLCRGARKHHTSEGTIVEHGFYKDVNGFVDFLADKWGSQLAVGCAIPSDAREPAHFDPEVETLSFESVRWLSGKVGEHLAADIEDHPTDSAQSWVALLASSSITFLLIWLGLIRRGLKVLLIAPQSSSDTVRQLLKISKATILYHDKAHSQLVRSSVSTGSHITTSRSARSLEDEDFTTEGILIPWASLTELLAFAKNSKAKILVNSAKIVPSADDDVYSFHSSGTTGRPKLITQTQHGAVGILPLLQESWTPSSGTVGTFTTTPLYHGGLPDLFRSWSAASPLWIYPENRFPITARNVLSCLKRIDKFCDKSFSGVKTRLSYISCVPFVLESMSTDVESLARLRHMEIVGVGGAALSKEVGDDLSSQGIKLVSRFGSAECGFLLSSLRNFGSDRSWNDLRTTSNELYFRSSEGTQLFELVVSNQWPLVSKAAHAHRPFNTHDLFASAQSIEKNQKHWTYQGRSDVQETLITGKKFDPTKMEDLLQRSKLIETAVVVGNGRLMPAALIFLSASVREFDKSVRFEIVRRCVAESNNQVERHARLDMTNVLLINNEETNRIRRNIKGGLIRSSIASDFAQELESLESYDGMTNPQNTLPQSLDNSVVEKIIRSHLDSQMVFDSDEDFFEAGLNSTDCMLICRKLNKILSRNLLRPNDIYMCGTINNLISLIRSKSSGKQNLKDDVSLQRQAQDDMQQMAGQYLKLRSKSIKPILQNHISDVSSADDGESVLLSGGTGFLGVHLLHQLLQDRSVKTLFVLVRGSKRLTPSQQTDAARIRIRAALDFHNLNDDGSLSRLSNVVSYIPYLPKEESLGWPESVRDRIVMKATKVIHAAWEVNFNLPLKAFKTHIKGLVNLFDVAVSAAAARRRSVRFVFCSSAATVQNSSAVKNYALRQASFDPNDCSSIGYAQSKWVAESILHQLAGKEQGVRVSVLRIGQLSGDTVNGIWSRQEAWPLMIDAAFNIITEKKFDRQSSTCGRRLCILPNLEKTPASMIDWLPANLAASAILAVIRRKPQEVEFEPIANEIQTPWSMIQRCVDCWCRKNGFTFKVISAVQWLNALEMSQEQHRAKVLIPLWRNNWIDKNRSASGGQGLEQHKKIIGESEPGPLGDNQMSADDDRNKGGNIQRTSFEIDEAYLGRIVESLVFR